MKQPRPLNFCHSNATDILFSNVFIWFMLLRNANAMWKLVHEF